jgi:predicted metal-dependent HD superfamily phosphohydrolase
VRAEYAEVPDDLFRTGRAAVLRQLLGLPRLFATPEGRRRWESRARSNLAAELASLG